MLPVLKWTIQVCIEIHLWLIKFHVYRKIQSPILLINSYHMQCEDEKTFTGIFLLVHFCYETTSVWIKPSLDVYQNGLPCVSKWLDCIAHTMWCTLGLIQHGGQTSWKSVLVSYINIIGVVIKEITVNTSWEVEQGKTFIKWILIGKTEDVHGDWFCGSICYFWFTVTTRYQKQLLPWNPDTSLSSFIFIFVFLSETWMLWMPLAIIK